MTLTPEQKEHAIELIAFGDKLEAVRYFQEVLNINADQALALAEKLEKEIESGEGPEIEPMTPAQQEKLGKSGVQVGKIVGILFMSIGLIMLVVVIYLYNSHQQFEERAKAVKGTVTAYQDYQSKNDDGSFTTMYTPTFEYEFNGQSYKHVSSTSTSNKEFEIGQTVNILVDPEDPKEILVNSFMEKWFVPLLLGIMGIVFSGIGYLVFRLLGRD